jgi:hypothetical protein
MQIAYVKGKQRSDRDYLSHHFNQCGGTRIKMSRIDIPEHQFSTLNQKDLLKIIIETSYNLLLGQVAKGRIVIQNEASFQLHFAYILKTIGELMQFSTNDTFTIMLETPYFSSGTLNKSGSKKAKIDIVIGLQNSSEASSCAIELKFFQKDNHREPNNRYDVYNDLYNLEDYVNSGNFDFGLFFVSTDHLHYVNQDSYSSDTADFDFRHGTTYEAGRVLEYRTAKPYGVPLILQNNYHFLWTKAGDNYFMMHFV